MSSYLISNERAPLAIGLFLAAVVIVGLSLFMLAVDETLFTAGKPPLSSTIRQQERELAALRGEAAAGAKEAAAMESLNTKLKSLAQDNQGLAEKTKRLTDDLAAATQAMMKTTGEFQAYKERYREEIRGKAKGKLVERMVTRSGTVYENVTIREVTPVGMLIRHESGSKRIPYEELPADLQDLYQLDANEKNDAVVREGAMQRSHEDSVALSSAANSAANENSRDIAERQRIENALAAKRSRISSLVGEISLLQKSIALEEAKLRRAESDYRIGGISRAPGMKIKLEAKHEELSQLNQQVSVLEVRLKALE